MLTKGKHENKCTLQSLDSHQTELQNLTLEVDSVLHSSEARADVNANCNLNSETPLYVASQAGNVDSVEISSAQVAEVNVHEDLGSYPIHQAVKIGNIHIVAKLLEVGADVNAKSNDSHETPLHIASQSGRVDIVEILLARGAEVNIHNHLGSYPIHQAVQRGNIHTVTKLIEAGADVNAKHNDSYETPLHIASQSGSVEIVEILLARGAEVNVPDQLGSYPIHEAVQTGNTHIVAKLIVAGANVDAKHNDSFETPLHMASESGRVDIVEILLARGAEVNVKDAHGKTPLLNAVKMGNGEIVHKLLVRGAEINYQDKYGETPLHMASKKGCMDIVQMLMAYGADLGVKTKSGETVLHKAINTEVCSLNDSALVKLLLHWGAEVNAKDNCGQTPLDKALVLRNSDSCIMELRNRGAVFTISKHRLVLRKYFQNIIKWNCAGLKLQSENRKGLKKNWYQTEHVFCNDCEQELERLETTKFGYFSLYDVFSKWNDPVLLSNIDMERYMYTSGFQSEFLIYAPILKALFVKNKMRLKSLNLMQEEVQVYLPEEVIRIILAYQ